MCVFETQGQASCRGRGKEPRLLPAGEGQWVERVNIADSQTGSGGQTEEEVKRIRSCLDGNSQNFEMKREQFRDGAAETGEKGQKQN